MTVSRMKVMLVDDDEEFTQLLHYRFDQIGGFEVEEVNDPLRALPAARRFRPDVILLDIVMPGIDGMELASRFANDMTLRETPVIFLTACVHPEDLRQKGVYRYQGHTYVEKPFRSDDLIRCIREHAGDGRLAVARGDRD